MDPSTITLDLIVIRCYIYIYLMEALMDIYKFDTHVHTKETSSCGIVLAENIPLAYKEKSYSGFVITDHYCPEFFEDLKGFSWSEKIEQFLKGYNIALHTSKGIDFQVLLGMEIRFSENWNDYLVYGLTKEFLIENKELYKLGLKKFRELAWENNLLIYQAHPFRNGIIPADPALLDGVEVFNGNQRHNSRNNNALDFAEKNNLKKISGSDFHNPEDLATGGILLPNTIKTNREFVNLLDENKIELI